MADYVTTRYGTRINVTGLTPEQVKRVLSVAQDNGAYGSRGATLAETLRQRNTATAQTTSGSTGSTSPTGGTSTSTGINTSVPVNGGSLGINQKTGEIDANQAVPTVTGAAADDTNRNFLMNNPGSQTDIYGNQQNITYDPATGQTSISQTPGQLASQSQQAFLGALGNFQQQGPLNFTQDINALRESGGLNLTGAPQILQTGDVRKESEAAADANYKYITKTYAAQKQQEIEAAKQELANRGIPIDPNPNSLYGRTLQQINQRYQDLDDQAKNQAITQSNQTLGALLGGQSLAHSAFLNSAVAKDTSNLNNFNALTGAQANQYNSNLAGLNSLSGITTGFNPQFTPFQGSQSTIAPNLQTLLQTISAQELAKYGIDKDAALKKYQINNQVSGSSSSGGDNSTPIIGGNAPGFGV